MKDNVKRILSVVLGIALLASTIPAALLLRNGGKESPTDAGTTTGKEFISMPITIRDFAADGMLFEFNQFEDPDDYYIDSPTKYNGLKAYFAEAPEVDIYDKDQFTNGANKKQNDGYVTYYPDDNGLKLSFKMKELNNGANYTRGDVDWVVIKFRTSKTYSTTNYPTITNGDVSYSAPFVAQRGPAATKDDPYGSSLKLYNNNRTLSSVGTNYEDVVTGWKKMLGTASDGDWQYTKVHLSGGENEVTYISLYINQKQGHVDFGGLWVFDSNDNAKAFIAQDYKYETAEFYNGDNKGYGLLMTDDNDFYNCLPSTSNNIAGSNLYINGSWGDATEPSAVKATLNSGTKQYVHGAVIRTNLVEAYLDKDGKPVYTDATITYLKGLLKKTLPVAWERTPEHGADKAYNLYHVMGVKLYNDNYEYVGPGSASATKDLAQVLRDKINGNDGTLEATKAKAEAGNLTVPTDVSSYYDAAYFLLHNTWRDSGLDATSNDGYGMAVGAYNKLNLIETTNSAGQKCYVFNSGYDDAVYDITNGVIYNSQVATMTKVQDTTVHSTGIIRGMTMPEARFNPIYELGYGYSGNIYATKGLREDQWKDTYYAKTNYNLSLEGHAQFIYYQDANQYFTFTGDDDVYLYINGTRVLDVGAAHSLSKVSLNLNDVAQTLGLVDGQVYDFDFFYMERHGTAANFGIETNIQIVDPSMTTTKTGYQNGLNTGYNGYVDPAAPMVYEFALENKGAEGITHLTFTDDTIGTFLSDETITLNSDTKISNLSVTLYNPDGTVRSYVAAGSLTEDVLKQYLTTGLAAGEKIVIYGFQFNIPADKWETRTLSDGSTSNAYFYNLVNTTATSASGQNLGGVSHWVVQKQKANYEDIHLYTWGHMDTASTDKSKLKDGGSVELTRSELADVITKASSDFTLTGSEAIKISNATGITDDSQTTNINKKAIVSGDTITYQATNTGADTYYVMVGTHGPINVTVYTYGVADSAFVLDYNLPVKFTEDVLNRRSVVDLASQNPFGTTDTKVISLESATYGNFALVGDDVDYRMKKIMNGTDTATVTLTVLETGKTEVTKFTGVEMPQTITVVPASIMHYEEDFTGDGALVYQGAWQAYGTGGNYQSAEQDMNYGYDPNYSVDKAAPSGLSGDASNGTIRVHTVQNTNTPYAFMTFTFRGTGFEILSRTTDLDYCIMEVDVKLSDGGTAYYNDGGEFNKFPVICESESGDLYQVPVVSVTNLQHATYTVTLSVSYNGSATNSPKIYMDGVRIYSPLEEKEEQTYYSSDEAKATITEVKTLIRSGTIVYAAKSSDDSYTLAFGDTAIENYGGEEGLVLKDAVNLSDYLSFGPNNELYLDGKNDGFSVIAFYVTADSDYTDNERTIQIGVHRKTDALYGDVTTNTDSVTLVYGSDANALTNGFNSTTVRSGTEQYYTIDVNNLTADANGRYLVIVGMSSDNNNGMMPVLSITNLKLSGYKIAPIDFELQDMAQNG